MKNITKHTGPIQATPYPISRLSPNISIQESLDQLKIANNQIATITFSKLQVIQDQIEHLQKEAIKIIEIANQNVMLHNISCQFIKRPGNTYYLYEKNDEILFFSIISPEEWGNMIPGVFKSAYRLEADMSWTLV